MAKSQLSERQPHGDTARRSERKSRTTQSAPPIEVDVPIDERWWQPAVEIGETYRQAAEPRVALPIEVVADIGPWGSDDRVAADLVEESHLAAGLGRRDECYRLAVRRDALDGGMFHHHSTEAALQVRDQPGDVETWLLAVH